MRILSLAWFAACGAAFAQGVGVGNITGIVNDSSGLVMGGVAVEAKNASTGVVTRTATNAAGLYSIGNLIPGSYQLTAEMAGFKRYLRSGLTVQVGETSRVDIAMQVGAVTESVDVVGAAPLVETESGALGEVIDNRKITQLPLIGRNVYSLINLVPGATVDNSGRTRVNGSRARSNEFLIDGVTQVIPETRSGQAAAPPPDSIEEFKVLTNAYSAEYGNGSGGLVNAATRSGTNEYRVTLWEFLRNDKLNTRNFFAPANSARPILRQNQFGLAGGGPISIPKLYDGRNRSFFFADYEGLRVRSQRVFNVTVPTAAMRAGNFSQFLGTSAGTDALGRNVLQGQVYDPATQRTVNGVVVRDPYPGNLIPQSQWDPVAVKLLDFWPSALSSGLTQNFQTATATGDDSNRFDVRGDHVLTQSNRVFARYSRSKVSGLPSVAFRGASGDTQQNTTEQTLTGAWTATLSPTKLNEFRFAYLDWDRFRDIYLGDTNVAQQVGIPGITTNSGVPFMDISDVNAIGNGFSGGFIKGRNKVISLIDHFSVVQGRHTIKFGGEARIYRLQNFQPASLNGSFAFRSAQTSLPGALQARTGQAFASFLLGLANQTQYTQKDPGQIVNNVTYGLFFQDDWKITRRLTLNLGVRYELNTALSDARGFHSTFDLDRQRVLAGASKPGQIVDRNNFGPRFGFAYDLTGDQRTVIRGGYGVFHQPIQGGGGNPLSGIVKFPFEFTSNAISPNGLDAVTRLRQGPILQQEFAIDDPRLGFGGNVQLEGPNLAPYVQQWNLGVERSLAKDIVFGAAYVASVGKKLESGRNGYLNLNQVPIALAQQAGRDQNRLNPDTRALRPYPNFNEVQPLLPRFGDSNFHSMQLKAEQRLRGGLNYLVAYTWSKSIDNNAEIFNFTGGSWPQDAYNLRAERAVSTADVPHRLVGSYVWDLPFGKGLRFPLSGFWNAVAGGWQVNGVTTLSSGRPVDVEQSTNTTATFSLMQRPNISGSPALSRDERTLDRFWDTSKFSAAQALNFGTSPRNPIRGPGLVNFDVAVIKQWTFQERRGVEFRAEMFNFTNTPSFILDTRTTYNPNLPLDRQTFGRITAARDGRIIQIALKLRL